MSIDALIARMSPSERAIIAAELRDLERSGDVWDPVHEVFRSLDLGKKTTKFLEELIDELRGI